MRVKVEDMAKLERIGRMMVRWTCGAHLKSRMASATLSYQLGFKHVTEVVR